MDHHHHHHAAATHTAFVGDSINDQLSALPGLMKKLEGTGADGQVDAKQLGQSLRELTKLADSFGDLQGKLDGLGGLGAK